MVETVPEGVIIRMVSWPVSATKTSPVAGSTATPRALVSVVEPVPEPGKAPTPLRARYGSVAYWKATALIVLLSGLTVPFSVAPVTETPLAARVETTAEASRVRSFRPSGRGVPEPRIAGRRRRPGRGDGPSPACRWENDGFEASRVYSW